MSCVIELCSSQSMIFFGLVSIIHLRSLFSCQFSHADSIPKRFLEFMAAEVQVYFRFIFSFHLRALYLESLGDWAWSFPIWVNFRTIEFEFGGIFSRDFSRSWWIFARSGLELKSKEWSQRIMRHEWTRRIPFKDNVNEIDKFTILNQMPIA